MAPIFLSSFIFKGPACGYHTQMPVDPLVSAIMSSVVSSVLESALTPAPPPVQPLAMMRALPEESRKGTMNACDFGSIRIDGQTYMLSPGAQVRDEANMIVMPGMVRSPSKVRYMVDFMGAVHRVWVLSAAEAALPDKP